jgi:hypothetical protein
MFWPLYYLHSLDRRQWGTQKQSALCRAEETFFALPEIKPRQPVASRYKDGTISYL